MKIRDEWRDAIRYTRLSLSFRIHRRNDKLVDDKSSELEI